jgi:tetratricopeptide (TPR) repeat protein
LAASQKDFGEAESKLQDSMTIFDRLGAVYEVMSIYDDIVSLALAQEDYPKAKEVALLLINQSKLARYVDLNIRALVALADCEINTGRQEEAMEDCSKALGLAKAYCNASHYETVHLLMMKVIEYVEVASSKNAIPEDQAAQLLESLKSKIYEKDFRNLLAIIPNHVELYRT